MLHRFNFAVFSGGSEQAAEGDSRKSIARQALRRSEERKSRERGISLQRGRLLRRGVLKEHPKLVPLREESAHAVMPSLTKNGALVAQFALARPQISAISSTPCARFFPSS